MSLNPVETFVRPPDTAWLRGKILERDAAAEEKTEQAPETTSRFSRSCGSAALALAFLVGTGGVFTADYVAARNARGYRLLGFEYRDGMERAPQRLAIRTAAQNLYRVREVLRPSVTELASLLGVSRQALYNWQAGQPVAPQNEERLEQFAVAADLIDAEGLTNKPSVIRRKLARGKTFFELVREGTPATDAAAMLVSLIKKERAQGEAVSIRLSGRERKAVHASDIGAPHLEERA
jgi:transcriptional regulator with XRE-family HTH domain